MKLQLKLSIYAKSWVQLKLKFQIYFSKRQINLKLLYKVGHTLTLDTLCTSFKSKEIELFRNVLKGYHF